MTRILAAPGSDPSRYVVMSRSAGNDSDIVLATLRSGALDLSEVSPELQAAVAANPGRQQTQMSEVTVGGQDLPAVIIGSVVEVPNAGAYDLYFIYPLGQEVATMDLITNAFAIAGLTLTLLVGAVAWVVTRQVVAPVRRASVVAQRLSAGKLNERMPSRGEDDLALLAHVVQRDGRQPPVADPPARGSVGGAAALRLRRLPRAAHPADDDPHGRRRHPRVAHRLRPLGRALRRAARR